MKLAPFSSFLFIFSQLLFTTFVAAASLPNPSQYESSDVSTSLSVRAGPLKDDLPPAPYQWRIKGTSISLIFGKFGGLPGLDRAKIMYVLFKAQTEIVKGVVENKGDGTILTPNLIWRHGTMYVTVNQHLELPWSILSKALVGIVDFYDAFYQTTCSVTILEDKAGILGEVIVGTGF